MRTLVAITLLAWMGLTAPALANRGQAEDCLRTKVWEGYPDGWGIRTMTSSDVQAGKTKNFQVTLYKGNTYRIQTCGDEDIENLDVLLYNAQGSVVARDASTDREPQVEFSPSETGTYYIVLYLRAVKEKKATGSAAMAVVYR